MVLLLYASMQARTISPVDLLVIQLSEGQLIMSYALKEKYNGYMQYNGIAIPRAHKIVSHIKNDLR